MTHRETNDEAPPARGFRVHGRVQGVGFRWWTRKTADELGLSGSVRNVPDGTVEIRAAGPADALAELERRLQSGPRSAVVRRVERLDPGRVPAGDFRIER